MREIAQMQANYQVIDNHWNTRRRASQDAKKLDGRGRPQKEVGREAEEMQCELLDLRKTEKRETAEDYN